MTAKTFEEWFAGLSDDGMGVYLTAEAAWTDSDANTRAALLADRPDVAGLVSGLRLSTAASFHTIADAVESLSAQNAALREYLEISDEHGYDGIACRDETIRMQDERIESLAAQLAERDAVRLHYEQRINELKAQLSERDAAFAALKGHAEAMAYISEGYWNGSENERAMSDALVGLEDVVGEYRRDYPKEQT
jgi:hypothetical protein